MVVIDTEIEAVKILEPRVFKDSRGYFFESYHEDKFNKAIGYNVKFIQDNEAFSTYGTIRGLHFQTEEFAQAKLVRVVQGVVVDVAVDIRKGSDTYGKYVAVELSEENRRQLFVPRGFAHGYVVKSKTAVFQYKVDNIYAPQAEGGVLFNDPELNIDWGIESADRLVSEKDLVLPLLSDL